MPARVDDRGRWRCRTPPRSPISHKGLTITTVTPEPPATPANPKTDTSSFVAIDPQKKGNGHLMDLLDAFKQFKVEPADQIDIIRLIHKAGKIHAQIVEE